MINWSGVRMQRKEREILIRKKCNLSVSDAYMRSSRERD